MVKKTEKQTTKRDYLNKSLDKALSILNLFNSTNKKLSITKISNLINANPSSLYPILRTLEKYGYLKRGEDKLYSLGLVFAQKGRLVLDNLSIQKEARAELETLRDITSRTVHFGTISANKLVYIDKAESEGLKLYSTPGKTAPLHATGLGKAMLAHLPPDQREKILSDMNLTAHTKNTNTSKEELKGELREVRRQGFAVDDEEFEVGVKCVAAPINKHDGEVEAAISVTGLAAQMDGQSVREVAELVKKYAGKISANLGYETSKKNKSAQGGT